MGRLRRHAEQQTSVTLDDIEADLNTGDIILLPGTHLDCLEVHEVLHVGFASCAVLAVMTSSAR